MASGGKRVPAKPAAVSGPGRFSARTDSGTAQMAAPGGAYGERQAVEGQAAAAPVPTDGNGPSPGEPGAGPSTSAVPEQAGVFGPTQRPNESPLAGVVDPSGPDPLNDPQMIFRVLAEKWPTPWILGMLND